MGIAITLREYLTDCHVEYEVIRHSRTMSTLASAEAAHIPGDRMAKSVLLGDDKSYVMAVIPATHRLDIEQLNKALGRKLELTTENELSGAFLDCEFGSVPPLGHPYGIDTVVDSALLEEPEIFFESGDHGELIHMGGDQFRKLLGKASSCSISRHL